MFKSSKGVPFKMDAWAAKQGVAENFITDCDSDIGREAGNNQGGKEPRKENPIWFAMYPILAHVEAALHHQI